MSTWKVITLTLIVFSLYWHTSIAQSHQEVSYLMQLTHEKKDQGHYFGPKEEIAYSIKSDSLKRKHYNGVITSISDSTLSINDTIIQLSDLTMIMSKGYRKARHSQWGMNLLAGAILTGSGTALLLSGTKGNGVIVIGVVGVLIGVPLLIRSLKAYFLSNRYALDKGWQLEVIHIQK